MDVCRHSPVPTPMIRRRFTARGRVQGVGFRPLVFTLAERFGLSGSVRNTPQGVAIEAQGTAASLAAFANALRRELPPLACITELERLDLPPCSGENTFVIAASIQGEGHSVLISPDVAVCGACLADMRGKGRRAGYAFTNCTHCGPRYSITRSMPYDRQTTSMACFPLCDRCREEYDNPRDRRFHAQPNACPDCGPEVWFSLRENARTSDSRAHAPTGDAALRELARFLFEGGIAAVKGLGGFHLVCDACNPRAVALLRERKARPHKPFAVMTPDVECARAFARVDDAALALLQSREHPIVLCPLRKRPPDGKAGPVPGISPDTSTVGVMLPYTPLHHVLLERYAELCGKDRLPVLVMTSGNRSGEPICLGNREAVERLGDLADAFLFHNRDILVRVDDSVVRPLPGGGTLFFRRARGYVPLPVSLDPLPGGKAAPVVLGMGADLKNTLCMTKGDDAFVSQHIGDMGNLETAAFHTEMTRHLAGLLSIRPEVAVRDPHPGYISGALAEELRQQGLPVMALQHHFAHAHAVLAEHRVQGAALVLVLDGTGFGEDGTLWGGEALLVNTETLEHKRLAHLAPLPLPGGEAAIREPWRIAHALLLQLGLTGKDSPPLPWLPRFAATAAHIPAILARRINTPYTTSAGRLFDAASALLGLCLTTSYEGQAAIRLEESQHLILSGASHGDIPDEASMYPCPVVKSMEQANAEAFRPDYPETGLPVLNTHTLFTALVADRARGTPVTTLARRFHTGFSAGLVALAAQLAARYGIRQVGLSGGCLQNVTLARSLQKGLAGVGLIPLFHQALPPNDGCISLGQAVWGRKARARDKLPVQDITSP